MRLGRLPVAWATAIVLIGAAATAAPAFASAPGFVARGSVQQVYATGLPGRTMVSLINRRGVTVARRRADALGGIVFRDVTPGPGYQVRLQTRNRRLRSGALTVLPDRSAPPSTRVYDQKLPADGYGYLQTRDGTKLAINVHLPGPQAKGPYPTLIEYAGYGYADPAGPQSGISPIANLLGFAVVDVNMRGTGCSGGSFDYFEPLQGLDGYDVIESVARQPWVLGHRVGMMGISYGGISQLFVAATEPPHLAAIAPLSVIDNTATTLYPGGILNTGFALAWGEERAHDALPASPSGGQPWALKQIRSGDQICAANQALHGEAPNLIAKVRANRYYVPAIADPLAPVTFVRKIRVPVYLACQWTDEQTGAHCPDLAEHFTGTRHKWFTFTNGAHIDSLDPQTFNRWYDFLELYVAHRAPHLPPSVTNLVPSIFASAMGIPGVRLRSDPIQAHPSYASALAAFEALKPIRVLFDNGAGSSTRGPPIRHSSTPSHAFRFRGPRLAPGTWGPAGRSAPPGPRWLAATSSPGIRAPGPPRISVATRPGGPVAYGRQRPATAGIRVRPGAPPAT